MSARERVLATMAFEPVDRVPLWEWGYWGETWRAWRREGAPMRLEVDEPENKDAGGKGSDELDPGKAAYSLNEKGPTAW